MYLACHRACADVSGSLCRVTLWLVFLFWAWMQLVPSCRLSAVQVAPPESLAMCQDAEDAGQSKGTRAINGHQFFLSWSCLVPACLPVFLMLT